MYVQTSPSPRSNLVTSPSLSFSSKLTKSIVHTGMKYSVLVNVCARIVRGAKGFIYMPKEVASRRLWMLQQYAFCIMCPLAFTENFIHFRFSFHFSFLSVIVFFLYLLFFCSSESSARLRRFFPPTTFSLALELSVCLSIIDSS